MGGVFSLYIFIHCCTQETQIYAFYIAALFLEFYVFWGQVTVPKKEEKKKKNPQNQWTILLFMFVVVVVVRIKHYIYGLIIFFWFISAGPSAPPPGTSGQPDSQNYGIFFFNILI